MLRIPRMQRVQEAYDTLESEGSRSEIFKRVMGDVTADIKLVNAEFSQACQCRASAVPCRTSASAVPCHLALYPGCFALAWTRRSQLQ